MTAACDELTNEELAVFAREDDKALETLIHRNEGFTVRMASGFLEQSSCYDHYRRNYYEDYTQICRIYMLMTVLRSELATVQSKALIRLFKSMKDYIIENQSLMITQREYIALADKVNTNISDIQDIKEKMNDVVTKADLSDFMKLFDSGIEREEILILDGEPFKADVAYQKIYRKVKRKIIVVDDYIGVKTLNHLAHSKQNTAITIISDNKARPPLRLTEYNDFLTENPGRSITFIQSAKRAHDRYIVLDEGTKDMKVYHCGASSKDAGNKITTITRLTDIDDYKNTIHALLGNSPLVLR